MSEDRYPPWRRTPQVCSELTIQITGLYRFKRGESTTLIVCKCSLGSAKSFTLCIPPEKLPLPISILFVSLRGQVPPRGSFYASLRRGLGHDGGGVLPGKRASGLKGHRTGTNNHVTLVCTKIQRSWPRNTVAASQRAHRYSEQRYSRGPTLTSRSSSAPGKDSPGKSDTRHLRPSACLSVTLETSLHLTLLFTRATNHPLHIQR